MTRQFIAICSLGAVLVVGSYQRAEAAVVGIVETNNSVATAQNVDAFFSLDYSADIGDVTGTNTSLIIPHVTVDALGGHLNTAPEYDWYSFTVPFAGAIGIFDIDYGMDPPYAINDGYFDANLQLIGTDGVTQLAINDDYSTVAGAGGSTHGYDSFIQYTFASAGVYYIGVGQCCYMQPMYQYSTNPDYALQISIGGHDLTDGQVPEPATLLLLGTGVAGLVRNRLRRRTLA